MKCPLSAYPELYLGYKCTLLKEHSCFHLRLINWNSKSPGHTERDTITLHYTMLPLELVQYALAAFAKDPLRFALFGSQWHQAMHAGPKS